MSDEPAAEHERSDVDPAAIGWLAVGLALFVIAVPLVMPLVFPQIEQRRSVPAPPSISTSSPVLAVSPKEELRSYRRNESLLSNSYGWTNRSQRVARIPIARAMELLVERGLPGWRQ